MLPHELGPELEAATSDAAVYLKMISNRGTKVYPDGNTNIDMVDHYRCRFMQRGDGDLDRAAIRDLLARVESRVTWMHVELLQEFDGEPSFTKAQGED